MLWLRLRRCFPATANDRPRIEEGSSTCSKPLKICNVQAARALVNKSHVCEHWTCWRHSWFAHWNCGRADWHLLQRQEHERAARASFHDPVGHCLLGRRGRVSCRHVFCSAGAALDMDSLRYPVAARNPPHEQEADGDTTSGADKCLTRVLPSMNAKATSYPPRLILFCLTILICAGCQSFRTGEYSYQELERRNQEQRETGKMEFKPEPERPFQR